MESLHTKIIECNASDHDYIKVSQCRYALCLSVMKAYETNSDLYIVVPREDSHFTELSEILDEEYLGRYTELKKKGEISFTDFTPNRENPRDVNVKYISAKSRQAKSKVSFVNSVVLLMNPNETTKAFFDSIYTQSVYTYINDNY